MVRLVTMSSSATFGLGWLLNHSIQPAAQIAAFSIQTSLGAVLGLLIQRLLFPIGSAEARRTIPWFRGYLIVAVCMLFSFIAMIIATNLVLK